MKFSGKDGQLKSSILIESWELADDHENDNELDEYEK